MNIRFNSIIGLLLIGKLVVCVGINSIFFFIKCCCFVFSRLLYLLCSMIFRWGKLIYKLFIGNEVGWLVN